MVRHYFLRQGANRADIQVNLVAKNARTGQSHDIAKRIREAIDPIGEKYGARPKVAEIPPGPPVIQTLVAEVYGPDHSQQIEVAPASHAVRDDSGNLQSRVEVREPGNESRHAPGHPGGVHHERHRCRQPFRHLGGRALVSRR